MQHSAEGALTQRNRWTPMQASKASSISEANAIAKRATEICKPGDSVVISCSITAYFLGWELCGKDIEIITNYFPLARFLIKEGHNHIVLCGGQYESIEETILSPRHEFSEIYSGHYLFTSGKGLTNDGLYKTGMLSAIAEQQMLQHAIKVVVIIGSEQIGVRTGMLFCPANQIDIVITGKDADRETTQELEKQGIDVIRV